MTKNDLMDSAEGLSAPAATALTEFCVKRERLVDIVNRAMTERPDLEKLVGPDGKQMSLDNNHNFSRFMESLWGNYHPQVLVDTVLWVFRAYRSHGFQTTYWSANLNSWMAALLQELSRETFEAVSPFYLWLITHVPFFVKLTDGTTDDRINPV